MVMKLRKGPDPTRFVVRRCLTAGFFVCLITVLGMGTTWSADDVGRGPNKQWRCGGSEQSGNTLTAATAEASHVLRHAVFFKFKETATDEDVTKVVDAFRALPEKIDTIQDFQWGTNNSPEGLNDGFTHCFLLTFADAEGRAAYLPHPAHKAFGEVLRPYLERVFVIDYWGAKRDDAPERELGTPSFSSLKTTPPRQSVRAVEDAFAALPAKLSAIKSFEWGKNNSPERHDDGFTHCFMVTFDSEDGRAAYLPDPNHQAFVEVLKPVVEKVRVLDFWVQK